MAIISVEEAAAKLDASLEIIEDWIGLLSPQPGPSQTPGKQFVVEEELYRVADGMSWLHLSQQNWDDAEEH
jgi:hypothetical protein